jgi:hypothetical protein
MDQRLVRVKVRTVKLEVMCVDCQGRAVCLKVGLSTGLEQREKVR